MKRVALFVGVDRYEDKAFRDLRYSVADAAALAAAFGRNGFETHVATNPGNRALLDEVERRTKGLGGGDVFLFFFAGHGYTGPGGEHLLICSDDRLQWLRHNRAGVPVNLLEDLTNGKGYHRAFLLDACRTDVFSGRSERGCGETRDLGLVALPDAGENPGTCCVLWSCDRFCPALEYEDLGHGVFTRAVLDLLDTAEGRALKMGEAFMGGVGRRMAALLRAGDRQLPRLDTNGEPFGLFVGESVESAAVAGKGQIPSTVETKQCAKCRRWYPVTAMFECGKCGKVYCVEHQDPETWWCGDCAAAVRERVATERKTREESKRTARNDTAGIKESVDTIPPWNKTWEEVLERMPEEVWGKIGALLGACAKRGEGAKALVFDARKTESLNTMAALLELLPVRMRREVQFVTYLHPNNVRETNADETFLFYGTVRNGVEADTDTGLYGALPGGGVVLAGRGDAEVFKRMVDVCGERLGAWNWDALVVCWEVATGRIDNPGKLRKAVEFAKGFSGLEAAVAEGLAGAFSDSGVGSDGERAVALAAWFELGMGAFGEVAKDICGECADDGAAFRVALRVLEGDGAKEAFLDETYEQAKRNDGLPGLAAMWLDCGAEARRLVPAGSRDRAFGKFTALVDRFEGIRSNVRQGMVATGSAAGMLNETERAAELLGNEFEGMEETWNGLRYLVALEKVKGMEDLKAFAREAEALGAKQERIREDGLKKVPLGWIPGDKLKAAVEAFGAIGVNPGELIAKVPDDRLLEPGVLDALVAIGAKRDEIIQRALKAAEKAAEKRGYESG